MNKTEEKIIVFIIGTLFWVPVICGLGVLGNQIREFLADGSWPERPFLILIQYISPDWVTNPETWIGLHKVFMWMPLAGGLILLGFSSLFIAILIDANN